MHRRRRHGRNCRVRPVDLVLPSGVFGLASKTEELVDGDDLYVIVASSDRLPSILTVSTYASALKPSLG